MAESTLLSRNCDAGIPARTIGAATIPDLLRSNGYVIFDRLLPEDTVEQICEELEPSFAATECGQADLSGRNTRIGSVLQKSPTSRAVAVHPIVLCVANAILGPNCDLFQLCLTQGVRVYPGRWQRIPHRDDETWQGNRREIEYLVNVMWALSDFTAKSGAPLLWPRSHFNQHSPNLEQVESVVAEMRRGSALVYLGSIMHCGGANLSREPLTGLHFSYCLDWLKQYGNSFESYPPEVTKEFPEMLRELLGICDDAPNLRSSKAQNSSVLFDHNSRKLPAADPAPAAIARERDRSRADGWCDAVASKPQDKAMTLEPESNAEDAAAIANAGPVPGRQRPDVPSPVARLNATALHSLDPIKGWLAVDGTLDLSPSVWRNRWREDRVSLGGPRDD